MVTTATEEVTHRRAVYTRKHIRQRNAMPAYWVLQAKRMQASNLNALKEIIAEENTPKLTFTCYKSK